MVAMKKFNSQLLSKHLYFEVTIQPAIYSKFLAI
jgi:hypothetical protein